jgi:alpha-galactosidase
MPIEWRAATRELLLGNGRMTYGMRVLDDDTLGHLYLGPALQGGRSYAHLGTPDFAGFTNRLGAPVGLECPVGGSGDFRLPAVAATSLADGSGVLHLRYAEHRVMTGKPSLPGLPSTYTEADDEAETVIVMLRDGPSGLVVEVATTIYRDHHALAQSLRVRNEGAGPIQLLAAASWSLDLPDAAWELTTLSGTWARERHVVVRPLVPGRQGVGSTRGASGHEHNPFLLLRRADTREVHGEAIGLSLVYSGNFRAEVEVEPFGTARVRVGLDPEGFGWRLEPGAEFVTPEAVLVYADDGLGSLSDTYHELYRERLARGSWRDRERPILVNSWEGAHFEFDEGRLLGMAGAASELGIELFVLDDGWFGARDDDTSSLGDWTVDRRKLPHGLDHLARAVQALGMSFGLWIEPEMVSPRSRLFEQHPDWAIGVPGRPLTESRQQLVLDMGNPAVVDHLAAALGDVLGSAPIAYVKWDMNRNITEMYGRTLPPDRQGEAFHRYMLGVYDLYDRLTSRFPAILFESCAGGGGRFDPGMLAFAPQAWTSDDTDAFERLRIQWGTSLVYPLSSMAAHVTDVPNQQVGRDVPLATRAAVAFFGVFGYELDPTALTPAERAAVADQVAFYKRHRSLFQRGRFVRLHGPFEGDGNETAWMVVAPDASRAIVGVYQGFNHPEPGPRRLRLRSLDPAATYRVSLWPPDDDGLSRRNHGPRGGDELMGAGLSLAAGREEIESRGDHWSRLFVLERIGG